MIWYMHCLRYSKIIIEIVSRHTYYTYLYRVLHHVSPCITNALLMYRTCKSPQPFSFTNFLFRRSILTKIHICVRTVCNKP